MAIDILIDATLKGKDAVGFILNPKMARFLALEMENGAKRFEGKGDKKFQFLFVCSFISCTQRKS